jgi:predicted ferric reductase
VRALSTYQPAASPPYRTASPRPAEAAAMVETQWKAGEHAAALEPLRHKLLPPALSRRHFHLAVLNRVGLSAAEAAAAALVLAAVAVLGVLQVRAVATVESGSVTQFLWFPLFVLILYRSPIAALFGVSMERSMFWHGLFALLATAYSILHGTIVLFYDPDVPGLDVFRVGFSSTTRIYWTGAIAAGLMLLTVLTSAALIRRAIPRLWLYSHHLLPLAAAVTAAIHGAPAVLAAVAIYVVDRLFGYVFQAHVRHAATKRETTARVVEDGQMVRLTLPRTFQFKPGQYVGVSCPAVARFEWHNFTIASAPSDANAVLMIKAGGRWTRNLLKHVAALGGAATEVPLHLLVHGPVGAVAIDWTSARYDAFVVFAGGVGVTPMISFYRELASQASRGRALKLARLVYLSRSRAQVQNIFDLETVGGVDVERHMAGAMLHGFRADVHLTSEAGPVKGDGLRGLDFCPVEWHAGRPDVGAIFAELAEEAKAAGIRRVGVLACGPEAMTTSVTKSARKHEGEVKFDVHLEHFY